MVSQRHRPALPPTKAGDGRRAAARVATGWPRARDRVGEGLDPPRTVVWRQERRTRAHARAGRGTPPRRQGWQRGGGARAGALRLLSGSDAAGRVGPPSTDRLPAAWTGAPPAAARADRHVAVWAAVADPAPPRPPSHPDTGVVGGATRPPPPVAVADRVRACACRRCRPGPPPPKR